MADIDGMGSSNELSPVLKRIEGRIIRLRGRNVILDHAIAELYEVETKVLNQAVRRHADRFPEDFMFRLADEESASLRSQIVILENDAPDSEDLRSQNVTSRSAHGGRRYRPYAFTEEGVAMLSSVLRSPRAILVNIEIMRAFVRQRSLLSENAGLSRRLDELESKYDGQFSIIFQAIRQLMLPPPQDRKPIGFGR